MVSCPFIKNLKLFKLLIVPIITLVFEQEMCASYALEETSTNNMNGRFIECSMHPKALEENQIPVKLLYHG